MPRNKLSTMEAQIRDTIANNLKMYCDVQKMTQRELARRSGIPVGTISGYFKQNSTPNDERVDLLAKALHVNPQDIDPMRRKKIEEEDALTTNRFRRHINRQLKEITRQLDYRRQEYLVQVAIDQLTMQKMKDQLNN